MFIEGIQGPLQLQCLSWRSHAKHTKLQKNSSPYFESRLMVMMHMYNRTNISKTTTSPRESFLALPQLNRKDLERRRNNSDHFEATSRLRLKLQVTWMRVGGVFLGNYDLLTTSTELSWSPRLGAWPPNLRPVGLEVRLPRLGTGPSAPVLKIIHHGVVMDS